MPHGRIPALDLRKSPLSGFVLEMFSAISNVRMVVQRAHGLGFAFIVWLIISSMSVSGFLKAIEDVWYDGYAKIRFILAPAPSVFLIELPFSEATTQINWDTICQHLLQSGIKRMVVTIPLGNTDIRQLSETRCTESTVLSVSRPISGESDINAKQALENIAKADLLAGLLGAHGRESGIRRLSKGYEIAGKIWPSLEFLAAKGLQDATLDEFVPDLRRPPATIPSVTLKRVLEAGVVTELAKEKIAIIGYAPDAMLESLKVPSHSESISLLRFEGLVIDALANNTFINTPSSAYRLSILALITLLLAFVLQPLRLRAGIMLLVYITLAELALGAFMLGFLATWLPLAEITFLQPLIFLGVYRAKALNDGEKLRLVLSSATAKLQKRTRPPNFLQSAEHWTLIARLIDQTLHLSRTILLERVPGNHRVKEIISLRCSLSDISEMRRDYERTPYTSAIAAGGIIEVHKYLESTHLEERQFLVPLTFGGEIMGFWAFGINSEAHTHAQDFLISVNAIADQVARLLYQRKIWQEEISSKSTRLNHLFEDSNLVAYRELGQSVLLMEQRLASLEQVFNNQSNAAILYDLFGHVVLINPDMTKLVAPAGIAPYALTATDFVAQLTSRPVESIRLLMRRLVMEHQPFSLPVTLNVSTAKHFILRANALLQESQDDNDNSATATLPLSSVLIELVDISDHKAISDMKIDLLGQISHKLSNQTEALLIASYLLNQKELTEPEREKVGGLVQDSAMKTSAIITSARTFLLAEDSTTLEMGRFPIDPMGPLMKALSAVENELAERQLSHHIEMPNFPVLLVADPNLLANVFVTIFRFLGSDAVTDSTLSVNTEEKNGQLSIRFCNEGFGIPTERLRKFMSETHEEASPDIFREMRGAANIVSDWEGSLDFFSDIGKGSEACLILPVF